MASAGYEIALATREDIPDIVALQGPNLRANGGTLSVRSSAEWFESVLSDMPILVARKAGRAVGDLVSSSKAAQSHVPIIQAMLQAHPNSATSRMPILAWARSEGTLSRGHLARLTAETMA